MKIIASLAIISSSVFLAGCVSHRPPVVYTTPGGQVISAGSDARSAADHALETSLRAELNRYGDLGSANPTIQLYANNGVVTLSGPVRSERDRQMIDTLVRNTPGVSGINDQLRVLYPPTGAVTAPYTPGGAPVYPAPTVTPSVPGPRIEAAKLADQAVANRISDELRRESVPADALQNVAIRVDNGAAYIQGYVSNQQQRQAIDDAVQHASGVTVVYDQIQVR